MPKQAMNAHTLALRGQQVYVIDENSGLAYKGFIESISQDGKIAFVHIWDETAPMTVKTEQGAVGWDIQDLMPIAEIEKRPQRIVDSVLARLDA